MNFKEARNPDRPSSSIYSSVPPGLLEVRLLVLTSILILGQLRGLMVALIGGPAWAVSRASC